MSYLALARKWRPRTFSQLIGQEPVTKALGNALNLQRLHHAYLFTGTRGIGKTSVARILAKALNCEKTISAEPCLVCDACLAIEQGRFIDLIEIDGASKTRVEDTRELLDNVHYAPTNARFKIYLIDEVHMFSQHSFNALLKTLEEPPTHVKFILATTEPQKLPLTVLSRCLQFHLRHLPVDLIARQLTCILEEEGVTFDKEALAFIAQAARGSMRDALSVLDQAITSCDHHLTAQVVKGLLGYTQQDYALQLIQALAAQNAVTLFSITQAISAEGGAFYYVLDMLLHYLHDMAVYQSIGTTHPLFMLDSALLVFTTQFTEEDLQLFYQIALQGREELALAPTLDIGFNMMLLRMLTFRPVPLVPTPLLRDVIGGEADKLGLEAVTCKSVGEAVVSQQAQTALATSGVASQSYDEQEVVTASFAAEKQSNPMVPTQESSIDWVALIAKLNLSGFALQAINNTEFVSREGSRVTLSIAKGHESLFTPAAQQRVEAALTDYYKNPIKISLKTQTVLEASPAQQKSRKIQENHQQAEAALQEDPLFGQIKQDFSAELVKNSIVLLKDSL